MTRLAPAALNQQTVVIAACFFYGGGALLGGLLTLLPQEPGAQVTPMRLLLLVPVLAAAFLALAPSVVPDRVFVVFNIAGTTMVTVLVWLSAGGPVAIGLSFLYVFVPLDSFFFYRRKKAVLLSIYGALVSGALWWPLGILPMSVILGLAVVNAAAAVIITVLVRAVADADVDELTGLVGRRGLDRAVDEALTQAERSGRPFTVAYLDLDGFKSLNDIKGHSTGDAFLEQVARAWSRVLPERAVLSRYGGDEFAVLLPDHTTVTAWQIIDDLRAGLPAGRTTSGGLAEWEPGDTQSLLFSRADAALYHAKRSGRDRVYPLPGTGMSVTELRGAVADRALTVMFQPVVDLQVLDPQVPDDPPATPGVVSAEALVRWAHPTRGLIPPDEFIPIAEKSGLIVDIGRFVLDEACRQVVGAQQGGRYLGTVAVNVSGRELEDPDYTSTVVDTLTRHGLDPRRLILEVTESSLAAEKGHAVETLGELRRLGIRIAVDDFGTGYSSLGRLSTLPADIVKIDKTFVNAIVEGRPAPIVTTIVTLANALALDVTAEGVEKPEQARLLSEQGVHHGQGWLFGRPVPFEELRLPRRLPPAQGSTRGVPVSSW